MTGSKRRRLLAVAALLGALMLLALPPCDGAPPTVAAGAPFVWDRGLLFDSMQRHFEMARAEPEEAVAERVDALQARLPPLLARLSERRGAVPHELLSALESTQFELAALAAAHRKLLPDVAQTIQECRQRVLDAARDWPLGAPIARAALYRVIYGGRAALEEALVQTGSDALPALTRFPDVASSAPSVVVGGITVRSGDVVLSRGGAPTSALIARGNDYPGNFSHAALVHVDPDSNTAVAIESLIEAGVVITPMHDYLRDAKLRMMLLRLRPDHPALRDDPLAIHQASNLMLERARRDHVPYDFAMRWDDRQAMFCSEVPFHAYANAGVRLWSQPSTMSAPGVVAWLHGLGVRHFETLVPSDLEYDPDLVLVAEWRDPKTLHQDRIDNAILDALLEAAGRGARLTYSGHLLPMARLAKGWSLVQGALGLHRTIPEGMQPVAALRVRSLTEAVHPTVRARLERTTAAYRAAEGYPPPYWDLVKLARQAVEASIDELDGALTAPR